MSDEMRKGIIQMALSLSLILIGLGILMVSNGSDPMELLSKMLGMAVYIGPFMLVIGILVFVHELGHFIAAKAFGMGVRKFSLGLGPRLIGFTKGSTDYRISLLPIGGFVDIVGQNPTEKIKPEDEAASFRHAPIWKRIIVLISGVGMNLITAIIVFTLMLMIGSRYTRPIVGRVADWSPAMQAGIIAGDIITEIDGKTIRCFEHVASLTYRSSGKPMQISIRRGEDTRIITLTPIRSEKDTEIGQTECWDIGLEPMMGEQFIVRLTDPIEASCTGIIMSYHITTEMLRMIGGMLTGNVNAKDSLGGPVAIAKMAKSRTAKGLSPLMELIGMLSVCLFVMNLLPIPLLDGGHILLCMIELVRGKQLKESTHAFIMSISAFLMILLMAFIIFNDMMRLI